MSFVFGMHVYTRREAAGQRRARYLPLLFMLLSLFIAFSVQ